MDTLGNRVRLVQSESVQLGHDLHALPPDAWGRPSACHRWTVRDVVGHLIRDLREKEIPERPNDAFGMAGHTGTLFCRESLMGAELYLDVLSRGFHGDAASLEGFPEAGTVNAASVAALVDQVSVARQESLGDQLLATFTSTSDQLYQLFARCRPPDWETRCYHPAAILPVRTFVDMWLTELVMHGWDIRSQLAPEAHLTPESFPTFPDMFTGAFGWFHWTLWPGVRRPAPVRYRFEVTGPVSFRTDLVVDGEQARLEPVSAVQAHVTLWCATEPFILLLYGRLPVLEAVEAGHITAAGEAACIPLFAQWFRGM